jgi:sarcosine oxidase subunit beta
LVPSAADLVIVGAGAVGCSIAYHLARRGQRNLVVVERETVGSGSTSKAAGGIRAQFASEVEIRFSLEGIEAFKRFKDEMGVDPGYVQEGYLFVVTDETMLAKYRTNVAFQNGLGVPSRLVSPDEAREIAPGIETGDVLAGVWCPIDGHATPNDVCTAYAAHARALGATILEQTSVLGIATEDGRVNRVETSAGSIATPLVINAAGPAAALVGRMVGADIPVYPNRRHIFVTEEFDQIQHPLPLVIDTGSGFYCRSERRTILMSPGDVGDVTDLANVPVDWSVLEETVEKGVRRFPILEQARVRSAWAGLRPLTLDQHAIVDWLPGVGGMFCAVGFGGHGFQHSPATGRYVAEWLLDGRPSIDLRSLSFARFDGPARAMDSSSVLSGVD